MRATTRNDLKLQEKIAIDTSELMQVLSCGRATAIEIGTKAGARCDVGTRRVLWNVRKLQAYLDGIAE